MICTFASGVGRPLIPSSTLRIAGYIEQDIKALKKCISLPLTISRLARTSSRPSGNLHGPHVRRHFFGSTMVIATHKGGLTAFTQRHPRYVFLVLFFLACTAYILFPWSSDPSKAFQLSGYLPTKFRSMTLETFIKEEEMRYAGMLSARTAMIKNFGPSADQVESYVQLLPFYPPAR